MRVKQGAYYGLRVPVAIHPKTSRKDAKAQRMTENEIGKIAVDAAYKVYKSLGPGLLESVHPVG